MTQHAARSVREGRPAADTRAMPAGANFIKVDPGTHFVTNRPDDVLVTVLGSCVAVCLRDTQAGIGGMNHFMLPSSVHGQWGGASSSLRYGNFAMEKLVNDILRGGGKRHRLEAKVFGGAAMMAGNKIGPGNIAFAETYLHEECIKVVARHLGGHHARRVHYAAVSGQAFLRALPREDKKVLRDESGYEAVLAAQPVAGSVELFD